MQNIFNKLKPYMITLASATLLYLSSCAKNDLVKDNSKFNNDNQKLKQQEETDLKQKTEKINLNKLYLDSTNSKIFNLGLYFATEQIKKENKKLIPDTLYSTLLINNNDTINYFLIYKKDENINKHFPIINFYTTSNTNPEDVTNAITYQKFKEGIKVTISHLNQVNLKYTEPNYFSKNIDKYSKHKDKINDVENYILANLDTTKTKEQVFYETNKKIKVDMTNLSNVLIKYITNFSSK